MQTIYLQTIVYKMIDEEKMNLKTFISLTLLAFSCFCFSACSTLLYNPMNDPVYLQHLQFSESMKQAVARGEMTQAQADVAINESYNHYLDFHQRQVQDRHSRMATAVQMQQLGVQRQQLSAQQAQNSYNLMNQSGKPACVVVPGQTSIC